MAINRNSGTRKIVHKMLKNGNVSQMCLNILTSPAVELLHILTVDFPHSDISFCKKKMILVNALLIICFCKSHG